MILFFRKIRQRLLQHLPTGKAGNRFTRYLIYALGEIALVMIGILLALQVNTANENRKDRILEKKYLNGILQNIEEDIQELEEHILMDSLNLNGYTILVRAFKDESIKSDPQFLFSTVSQIQLVNSFEGNSIIFEDLKSSGRTNLIQSDSLRYQILSYYNLGKTVIKSEQESHNPVIIDLRNEISVSADLGINSGESFFFPDYWVSELNPDTPFSSFLPFFDSDIKSPRVKLIANQAGYIKALILAKRRDRINLLHHARRLKEKVEEYLSNDLN